MKKNNSSILLFTLLLLAVVTFLTNHLVHTVWIGDIFNRRMVEMEQARFIALSGINLAISQLTVKEDAINQERTEKDQELKALRKMLARTLPNLNRWQVFEIEEKIYGINGQVKFCVSCENGKININQAFDFQKQEFKKEFQRLFVGLHIKGKFAEGEILKKLTEFFKKRKRKIDEISELVKIEGLDHLDIFYRPPLIPKIKKEAKPNGSIYLQDLFTVWSDDEKINLLFLSDSACAVFGLRRPLAIDSEFLKEKYENFIKEFNPDWAKEWDKNWNTLVPFYGEKTPQIKDSPQILSKEVGGKVYSVLSCGVVGQVEQKVLAIIKEFEIKKEEMGGKEKSTAKEGTQKRQSSSKEFKIMKIYWL